MSWKQNKWVETLATVAPTIATAVGGPLAGVAVNIAAQQLGIDGDEKALEAAVAAGDPDVLYKLKTAEIEFKKELKRLGIEEQRIAMEDRKSARSLAIAKGTRPQIILSTIYTAGYIACLYALFSGNVEIGASVKDTANQLVGIMSAAQLMIMQFWFGSSAGSKAKDQAKIEATA